MASVTSIYARAFADVVFEKGLDGGKILEQLRALSALLHANPDLRRVWENPSIAAEQKRGVLDAIAAREGVSKPVRNFVAVVIDHRRMHFFDAIVRQLQQELDARMGFAEAQVISFRDLSEAEKTVARVAAREAHGQESACALFARCCDPGRRDCAGRQHDLRWLRARAVGENSGTNCWLAVGLSPLALGAVTEAAVHGRAKKRL